MFRSRFQAFYQLCHACWNFTVENEKTIARMIDSAAKRLSKRYNDRLNTGILTIFTVSFIQVLLKLYVLFVENRRYKGHLSSVSEDDTSFSRYRDFVCQKSSRFRLAGMHYPTTMVLTARQLVLTAAQPHQLSSRPELPRIWLLQA